MCIVIDACCADDAVGGKFGQGRLILDWVKSGGRVVTGGKLELELKGTSLQRLLVQWSRAGRLQTISQKRIDEETALIDLSKVKSNDLHVLALCRASGAKVVVTRDNDLKKDLKKSGQALRGQKIYPFPTVDVPNLRVQRGVLNNAGCR